MAVTKTPLKKLDALTKILSLALSIGDKELDGLEKSRRESEAELNYQSFIYDAPSTLSGYVGSFSMLKSGKIKANFKRRGYNWWLPGVISITLQPAKRLSAKDKRSLDEFFSKDKVLLSRVISGKFSFDEIKPFMEFFTANKPESLADFKVSAGRGYKIQTSRASDYDAALAIALKGFVACWHKDPQLILALYGVDADHLQELLGSTEALAAASYSNWHRLPVIAKNSPLFARMGLPWQEDAQPLLPSPTKEAVQELAELTYVKLGSDYSGKILSLLSTENPKDFPKTSFHKFLKEFYAQLMEDARELHQWRFELVQNHDVKPIFSLSKELPILYVDEHRFGVRVAGFMVFLERQDEFLKDYFGVGYRYCQEQGMTDCRLTLDFWEHEYSQQATSQHCLFYCTDSSPVSSNYGRRSVPKFKLSIKSDRKNDCRADGEGYIPAFEGRLKLQLLDVLEIINPAALAVHPLEIQVLFHLYILAMELLRRGAVIPEYVLPHYYDSFYFDIPENIRLCRSGCARLIPAITFPEIKDLTLKVGGILRKMDFNKLRNENGLLSGLLAADELEIGKTFLSFMIEKLVRKCEHSCSLQEFLSGKRTMMLLSASFHNSILARFPSSAEQRKIDLGFKELPDYFGPLYAADFYPDGLKPVFFLESGGPGGILALRFRSSEDEESAGLSQSEAPLIRFAEFKSRYELSDGTVKAEFLEILLRLNSIAYSFPFINTLTSNEDGQLGVVSDDLPDMLFKTLPSLKSFGFEVVVDKSLAEIVRPRTQLRLKLRDSWNVSSGFLNFMELMEFDFDYSIGDQEVSAREFSRLLKSAGKIVEFKGSMVYITEEDAARLKRHQEERRSSSLSKTMLLASALTGEFEEEEVSFEPDVKKALEELVKKTEIKLPAGITAVLRPYQERGYNWLMHNLNMGMGSIIADDMGLGKTLQVICCLAELKDRGELDKRCALVVVPATLLYNWEHEFKKFAPALNFKIVYGSRGASLKSEEHEIFLTTYNYLVHNEELFSELDLRVLVVDEAQRIKNSRTQAAQVLRRLKRASCIAMTGTPVENHLIEYWAIMDLVNPGLLGGATFFRNQFAYPIERDHDLEAAETLKTLVTPFVLRRVKTDKSIIADLPDKLVQNNYCSLSPQQAALYQAKVNESLKTIEEADPSTVQGRAKRAIAIFSALNSLKQICDAPSVYDENSTALDPESSGKCVVILDLLEKLLEQGKKIIIFTQYLRMGDLLQSYIKQRFGFDADFLTGEAALTKRQQMIDDFQEKADRPILLLSLKAGGAGINLTAASAVIHVDLWWNPAVENQATDRAYRIGQDKQVEVYRFLCTGTIEEHIDGMLEAKRELNELTVKENERWLGELSREEISSILNLKQDGAK